MKKLFLAALMMSLALAVNAQSGMNSPYINGSICCLG